jgi:CheY-like chemotaxis protein
MSFPFQSTTILIVDDHDISIQTFSDYLDIKGYRVIIAQNGRKAVTRTKQEHPDLILMDIHMPEMDGFETIRCIREDEATRHIPIIALTALVMPGDRERCLDAGADAYLGKPASLRELGRVIEDLLLREKH